MGRIADFFRKGWVLTLIGALLLIALIWFVGPLIAVAGMVPLESVTARAIAALVVLLLWTLYLVITLVRADKAEKRIADAMTAPAADKAGDAGVAAEVATLRDRLDEALRLLRQAGAKSGKGKNFLYQLPWYVLIGPPGSGKTTALRNAGLNFPLADRLGKGALRGIGGTRNCDWWFTDEAVLLDTAGRYTTQDSDAAADRGAWLGFLDLLKQARPRQPINGVLVAISLADIALCSESERQAHARAVRERIDELSSRFGLRLPVYLILTKADLLAGFSETFDDLDRERRAQVWGMTFPLAAAASPEGAARLFDAEFDLLMQRLESRLPDRLQQEEQVARRAMIFKFPQQVVALKAALGEFVSEVFAPSRFDEPPLLRGVYITSATQEGAPFDRIMAAVARSFGVRPAALPAFAGGGKSFFLTDLLKQVVFNEAGLVGIDAKAERRRAWIRRVGFAAMAAVVLLVLAGWTISYLANRQAIARTETALEGYRQQAEKLPQDPLQDPRPEAVLPALAQVAGLAEPRGDVPVTERLGLYQGDKLEAEGRLAYRRALNGYLLPRLEVNLESRIRENLRDPEVVYEALKVYLMLGGEGPLDPELVRRWHRAAWQLEVQDPAQRQALAGHLDALLSTRLDSPLPLDGPLVEQARGAAAQVPLAQRAFQQIARSESARSLPEWRPIDAAGAGAARVLVRRSGKPLTEGIPGLYTYDGFHFVFLPALAAVTEAVAAERWVLGPYAGRTSARGEIEQLQREVLALYENEYIARWQALLADIALPALGNPAQAADIVNQVSGPSSPLKSFLTAAARETKLTVPPPDKKDLPPGVKAKLTDAALKRAGRAAGSDELVAMLAKGAGGAAPATPPGQAVEDRFRDLQGYALGTGQGPAPIDDTLRALNELFTQLNRLQVAGSAAGGGAEIAALVPQIAGAAARAPEPMNAMLNQIAQGTSGVAASGTRAQLDNAWKSSVVPFCRQALDNRYPLFRNANADVPLGDFSRLFGPGGLIDGFFANNLRPYVDASTLPWRWTEPAGAKLGIPVAVLRQFERAAAIRDAFFAGGAFGVKFQLVPVELAPTFSQVLVEIDGQSMTYAQGPTRPAAFAWPGPTGIGEARVSFTEVGNVNPRVISTTGPWAIFRLLDQSEVSSAGGRDRSNVTFRMNGRPARFEMRAGSVINPFSLRELGEFRCPPSL